LTDDICVEGEAIPDDKIREAILLFSRKRAASVAQVGFELGLNPSSSIFLTQCLVNKGFVSGSHGNNRTVRLDEFYSLTTAGVRIARSFRKKEGSI
jgi:hypothetical protein